MASESTLPQQTLLFCMTAIGIHRSISKLWYVYYCEPYGSLYNDELRGPSGRPVFFLKFQQHELLLPGWDASPSQGYPPTLNLPVTIYIPGWREALRVIKGVLPKNTIQCPSQDFWKTKNPIHVEFHSVRWVVTLQFLFCSTHRLRQ